MSKWYSNTYTIIYSVIFFLTFFDFFFLNIKVGPLYVTLFLLVITALAGFFAVFHWYKREAFSSTFVKTVLAFYGSWFAYGLIQLIWAKDTYNSLRELYYFIIFIGLIFVLLNIMKSKIHFTWMVRLFIALSIWLMALGFLELASAYHLNTSRYIIEERYILHEISKATGIFYNENDLSFFLTLTSPFFLVALLQSSWKLKSLTLVYLGLATFLMYANDSKMALITLMLQSLALIYIMRKAISKRVYMLGGLALVIFASFFHEQLFRIFRVIIVQIVSGEGSSSVRLNLILNGLYTLYKSYFLGVGPGGFEASMYPIFYTGEIVNPHNWWIELLTNYGVIIFAAYVYFFIKILKELFNNTFRNDKVDKIALALLLSLIGFILGSMGPSRLFFFTPMWFLFGTVLAYLNYLQFYKKEQNLYD